MKAIVCYHVVLAAILLACRIARAQTQAPSRDDRSLPEWMERTNARDDAVLQNAALAIGKLGPEAKAALLVKMLDDKSWYVREAAAKALERIGPDAKFALPSLVKMLAREEVTNRYAAANALGKIGPGSKAAAAALAEAATDDDGEVRDAALAALDKVCGETNAVASVLLKHLGKDEEYYVKIRALKALATLGPLPKEDLPAIAKLLGDESCRAEAFATLLEVGPAAGEYLPQLVNAERAYPHWDPRHNQIRRFLPGRSA
jgi:HEAT repeat protein